MIFEILAFGSSKFGYVFSLPSGATITRVIQRKRPTLVATKLGPPQKKRKVEVNAGAGTSGGHPRITIKSKLVFSYEIIRCFIFLDVL